MIKNEKGAAAVEFALVLPILLILLFGIIEFGLIMYNKAVITNGSREGARAGIVNRSPRYSVEQIESVVNNYIAGRLISFSSPSSPATIEVDQSDGTNFGDTLKVRVEFQYEFLILPNFADLLGPGLNLVAETAMKYE